MHAVLRVDLQALCTAAFFFIDYPNKARLKALAQAGKAVQSDRLLVLVWGHRGSGDRQLLKQLVHRFRHKIGDDSEQPRWLETVPNIGYRVREK